MTQTTGLQRTAAPRAPRRPTPWGTVAGAVVLGVGLLVILGYAVLAPSSGAESVGDPDALDGVVVAKNLESVDRSQVPGAVSYRQTPPNAGPHNPVAQTCAIYPVPIAPEHAVRSLEVGAVWITYNGSVPPDSVAALAAKVRGNPYRLMSPVPQQNSPIDLSAWGRRLSVRRPSDPRVQQFLQAFTNGPQTPEPGVPCAGTRATGPLAR